jgi:hypothetical protein
MAEPTPVLAPPEPGVDDVYRPLSALAVASIVVAGGYAALVTILSVVAFATSTPLFLAIWTVVFPAAGLFLAVLGRLRIRNSEGVLSGMVLTTWAWWLSLLYGLGYIAYYVGAYLAVSNQAEAFTTDWLRKVADGKMAEAFLETQEPAKRKGINPADTELLITRYGINQAKRRAPLVGFQEQEIIRVLQRGGSNLKVTPLGVKSWEYDKGGYQVVELYQVGSVEGTFDITVTVRSAEGPEFEGRKWYVLPQTIGPAGPPPQLTTIGKALDKWYRPAHEKAVDWVKKRNDGQLVDEPKSFILADDFQALNMYRMTIIAQIKERINERSGIIVRPPEGRGWWKLVDADRGIVQSFTPVGILVMETGKEAAPPRYFADAAVVLESAPGEIREDRDPGWKVVGLQLIRGGVAPVAPGQGPGGDAMAN